MSENNNNNKFTAIVLAAGEGKRMNSPEKKQFIEILGKPVVVYSLEAFEANSYIDNMILVVPAGYGEMAVKLCVDYNISKVHNVVEGGKERFNSVYNALQVVDKSASYVLIHDGARPLISEELINRLCEATLSSKAAILGTPVTDTIKKMDYKGYALSTIDRKNVCHIQTPEGFSYELIIRAYEALFDTIKNYNANTEGITDDAVIVENMTNTKVAIVRGEPYNIKITTPFDLDIVRAYLEMKAKD